MLWQVLSILSHEFDMCVHMHSPLHLHAYIGEIWMTYLWEKWYCLYALFELL